MNDDATLRQHKITFSATSEKIMVIIQRANGVLTGKWVMPAFENLISLNPAKYTEYCTLSEQHIEWKGAAGSPAVNIVMRLETDRDDIWLEVRKLSTGKVEGRSDYDTFIHEGGGDEPKTYNLKLTRPSARHLEHEAAEHV